jgi:hypothetical protein
MEVPVERLLECLKRIFELDMGVSFELVVS